jgi:hypothetical protein
LESTRRAVWNKKHKDALEKHKNALDAKKHKDELDAKKHQARPQSCAAATTLDAARGDQARPQSCAAKTPHTYMDTWIYGYIYI